MNRLLVLALTAAAVVAVASATLYELLPYDPVANPGAIVTYSNARFTVLTARLIRMEYSDSGEFVDQATVAILNRNLTVPHFTVSTAGGQLVITTDSVELTYKGGPFTPGSLSVASLDSSSAFTNWNYGANNAGNLLGTIKSLDTLDVITLNCTLNANTWVHGESLHCAWGVISRDGWAIYDDTENYMLTAGAQWWDGPNTNAADLYGFFHGWDYVGALGDFVSVSGKTAMVPRYANGIFWTRWLNFDNHDVQSIVKEYESRSLPLDVFILDMDWHTKYQWGTYSFDNRLFPIPQATFDWFLEHGLVNMVNLHDDNGVMPYEDTYAAFAAYMGVNPPPQDGFAFAICSNMTYGYGLEDVVLASVVDQGIVGGWWIDWQQGGPVGGCTGLSQNPTIWLNKLRATDYIRRGEDQRGYILARFGGVGSHRYQSGFSGDVNNVDWTDLAFQPYFSMTASNIGFGFWSHDLVGTYNDHDLYTRWLQWGAWSGVFRSHDRGMSSGGCANSDPSTCAIVEPWAVGKKHFQANRAAMVNREELIPYIYTATREAFDTGVSLLRPMYYSYPQFDQAYAANSAGDFPQYMFGDSILVSPIVTPQGSNDMAEQSVWLPPGQWYEVPSGLLLTGASDGSTVLTKEYAMRDVPVFVAGGAVIPKMRVKTGDTLGLAMRQYTELDFEIYPGGASGCGQVYEDDAMTTRYLAGETMWTRACYEWSGSRASIAINISSEGQGYASFPSTRKYRVLIVSALPLASASVNGQAVSYKRFGGSLSWSYDGDTVTTMIETGSVPTDALITIDASFIEPVSAALMSGMRGRSAASIHAKKNLDVAQMTIGSSTVAGGNLSIAASTSETLEYLANSPSQFMALLESFPTQYQWAIEETASMEPAPPAPNSLVQLWDAARQDNCLCGVTTCLLDNGQYQFMRIEGYQPEASDPGAVPFNDFWNGSDNWGTTASSTPSGYQPAAFANGYVLSSPQANTLPLQLWYSGVRGDHLTVASAAGVAYAQQNGYALVDGAIGYVFTDPPLAEAGVRASTGYLRWLHSMAILNSMLVQ